MHHEKRIRQIKGLIDARGLDVQQCIRGVLYHAYAKRGTFGTDIREGRFGVW